MAAPECTNRSDSAPVYSALAADGERILELQSSQPVPSANLPDQGLIEGVVSVTTLEYVKSVAVKVEATVKAFFMERGVPGRHTEAVLFQRSVILYQNDSGSSATTLEYPFSITLPESCDKSTILLPPSYTSSIPGVSAEVRYHIHVDMSRSGLERRDSLVVPILYLPRSYTPPNTQSLPLYGDQISLSSVVQEGQSDAPPSTDIQAKVALPSSLVVASGDRIPFTITIYSQSQALAALYTEMVLQLVKVTRIKALQKTICKEEILASGETHAPDDLGNGLRILRGEVGTGLPGAELAWSAAEAIGVLYLIRLSIKPPSSAVALSTNLPTFEHMVPVVIMTHRYNPDVDTSLPALGIIGINSN
ncbi:unnamed protein product [Rhizoctonia solani]|uniref:Uncharacterized protein n=1 Tax=Rhizoctonia solani TaxID=456999 RepID=A0A8H3B3N1_9AGAM|nr:unnamed protein product [Rhizoctonia solani]